jgi:hypothetical protein
MVCVTRFSAITCPVCLLSCIIREHTGVAVPNILAWSVEAESNSVGFEYLVMEAAPGISLIHIWNRMTGVQHIQCIQSIGKMAQSCVVLSPPTLARSTSTLQESLPVQSHHGETEKLYHLLSSKHETIPRLTIIKVRG